MTRKRILAALLLGLGLVAAVPAQTYFNLFTQVRAKSSAAVGDLYYTNNVNGTIARLAIGTIGDCLVVSGSNLPSWSASCSGGGSTSPLTTKGDLWGFSTVDARLPVGTNGDVLTADSAATLGVSWQTPTGGGGLSGGTTDRVPYWTSSSALGNSDLRYDSAATRFGIGASPAGTDPVLRIDDTSTLVQLQLTGQTAGVSNNGAKLRFATTGQNWLVGTGHGTASTDFAIHDETAGITVFEVAGGESAWFHFWKPRLFLRTDVGDASAFALYNDALTASSSNYSFAANPTVTKVNATSTVDVKIGNTSVGLFNSTGLGLGNATAVTTLDVNGDEAVRSSGITLSNGLNSDVSLTATTSYVRITGPTAAFTVGGLTTGQNGKRLFLYNATSFAMTIANEHASSTAANRITTTSGADMVAAAGGSSATLVYDSTSSRWLVQGINPVLAAGGGGSSSVTVTEVDASPSITASTVTFPNNTVTNSGGGVATISDYPLAPPTGMAWWYKADGTLTKNGSDQVSQWNDESGNSQHLVNASCTTTCPVYQATGLNGSKTLRFTSASSQFLKRTLSAARNAVPLTVYVVARLRGNGSGNPATFTMSKSGQNDFTGNDSIFMYNGSQVFTLFRSGGQQLQTGSSTIDIGLPVIWAFEYDGTFLWHSVNATFLSSTTTATTAMNFNTLVAGARMSDGTNIDNFNDVDISEIIGYYSSHTLADRRQTILYLKGKYGILY